MKKEKEGEENKKGERRKKKGEGREPDERKRRTKGSKEARTPALFKGFK